VWFEVGGNMERREKFFPHTAKIFEDANLENKIINKCKIMKVIIERQY
jgi:hypothetical protein